jgi:hypothetical protein
MSFCMTPKGPPVSSAERTSIRAVRLVTLPKRFDNAITTFPQMKEVKIGRQMAGGFSRRGCLAPSAKVAGLTASKAVASCPASVW